MRSCMMGSSLRGVCKAAWCSPSTSSSSPSSGTVSFMGSRDRLGVGGGGGTQMPRLWAVLPSAAFPDLTYRHPAECVLGHRSGQPGQCPGAHQGGGHSNHLLMADHDSRGRRDVGTDRVRALAGDGSTGRFSWSNAIPDQDSLQPRRERGWQGGY